MKDKSKNEKYKVMVWGPGKMGSYAMYYFINSKEFELVGVRGYLENEIVLKICNIVQQSIA